MPPRMIRPADDPVQPHADPGGPHRGRRRSRSTAWSARPSPVCCWPTAFSAGGPPPGTRGRAACSAGSASASTASPTVNGLRDVRCLPAARRRRRRRRDDCPGRTGDEARSPSSAPVRPGWRPPLAAARARRRRDAAGRRRRDGRPVLAAPAGRARPAPASPAAPRLERLPAGCGGLAARTRALDSRAPRCGRSEPGPAGDPHVVVGDPDGTDRERLVLRPGRPGAGHRRARPHPALPRLGPARRLHRRRRAGAGQGRAGRGRRAGAGRGRRSVPAAGRVVAAAAPVPRSSRCSRRAGSRTLGAGLAGAAVAAAPAAPARRPSWPGTSVTWPGTGCRTAPGARSSRRTAPTGSRRSPSRSSTITGARSRARSARVAVDAVCVSHGFTPRLELAVAAGCRLARRRSSRSTQRSADQRCRRLRRRRDHRHRRQRPGPGRGSAGRRARGRRRSATRRCASLRRRLTRLRRLRRPDRGRARHPARLDRLARRRHRRLPLRGGDRR